MLLRITTTHQPATDLGYLWHKNPSKVHSFDLSFGNAHLFYDEATADRRCRARLLVDVDSVGLVRGIEHLDPPRLAAFERVLFGSARPKTVIVTTANAEYNVKFETLPAGQFRHKDHRFEWTRQQFQSWSRQIAEHFGYNVRFLPLGEEDFQVGAPTQLGVFDRA